MRIYRLHRAVRHASNYVEVLVHLDNSELPTDYVWSAAELSNTPGILRAPDLRHVSACQNLGERWVRESGELAVRVPSMVVPEEFNVLLNPGNAAYDTIAWLAPRPFQFDSRLFVLEPRTL